MTTFITPTDARSFELLSANKSVLELMANNRPIDEILNSIVKLIEVFASGCISTVYFVRDGKLCLGAAPSFPESFVKAVDGCPIGHNQGTCGHAAFHGKRAISTDVTTDEVWGPFQEWILSYGIKAAWSTPVLSEDGVVMATVSMCWKEKRVPTEWDFQIVDTATSLMKIAVERKRQEEVIEKHRNNLITSSRLAALGEMAANLAHEINNPLTIIQGQSKLLQQMHESLEKDPEKIKKISSNIEKTVTRIAGIVKGLKAISKDCEHDPFEVVEIKSIIEETVNFCNERFRMSNIALKYEVSPNPIYVECRHVQISQALLNLLNNAFDAVSKLEEKWVSIEAKMKNDMFILTVADSGKGISPELHEKIMNPFFTTKSAENGTGLGLSITKKIIELHGGKLTIKSDSPNTCFEILLPLTQL